MLSRITFGEIGQSGLAPIVQITSVASVTFFL